MNWYEHIFEILLALVILFLFPCIYFGQKQEILAQSVMENETMQFIDEIRSVGYVTKEMYQEYLDKLTITGQRYNIELEHKHREYEPEYRFRTPEEVIEAQNSSYEGTNQYYYRPIHTDIPTVEDPIRYEGNLNTETNESVLEWAVNTPPDPQHIHQKECYFGHRHTDGEGVLESSYEHGCYTKSYQADVHCTGYMVYDGYYMEDHVVNNCTICGRSVFVVSHGYRCDTCDFAGIFHYQYECVAGHSQGGSGYAPTDCTNTVNLTRYYCDMEEDLSSDCDKMIANITPTHPMQTVYTGDSLITTVTATYLDGSQKIVVASANSTTEQVVTNKSVVLTYTYNLMGIEYVCTSNITINVIPRGKTCSNGHDYNLDVDGNDPGCPYCNAWLLSLSVYNPQSNSMTISKGTSLQENGVILLATYLNGRAEYIDSEYLDNLDMEYVGTQTVTLSYKGKYTYLTVISKRKLIQCSICNRDYELYPDNSDPGCPYCAAQLPIFTGNVMEYVDKRYMKQIERELFSEEGTYYFKHRDYIQINVIDRGTNWLNILLKMFHQRRDTNIVKVSYSGYIREDGGI